MHILLLNDDFPATGGRSSVAAIVACLAKQYASLGHTVTVLTSHRKETSSQIIRLPGVISLPISYRASLRHYHCVYSPSVSRMLEKEMETLRPDVVHAHNLHGYLTYRALNLGRKYAKCVFVTLHDVMSFAYWRLNTDRYLSTARDAHLTMADHWRVAGLQFNPTRNWMIRRTFNTQATGVFAVSHALKDAVEQNGIENVKVVHNGIDADEWKQAGTDALQGFQKEHGLAGRRVLLFGGRLSTDKGSTPVLQAVRNLRHEFPDILLFVAGDKRAWDTMLRASGVPDHEIMPYVRLAGWLDPTEMRLAYQAAHIVTTPSLCLDCFPQTNLEAMATAKPVVGTVFGGTPEAVEHGVTGFVCDPRTSDYEAYLRTLLQDTLLRERMGKAGFARAQGEFSAGKQAQTYLAHYVQAQ